MKKTFILIIVGVLIILFFMIFRLGGEDSWIKDERGVWVKHGVPSETPEHVLEQQEIIECAYHLYDESKIVLLEFDSECLGTCGDYAVDVVHVPRNSDDDLIENQCEEYRDGKVNRFIELDKDGEVVRIV